MNKTFNDGTTHKKAQTLLFGLSYTI